MAVTDPLIGRMLGDYRVVSLLGRGGMARVYRGYDPKLERNAAIKVIDAHLLSSIESEDEYRQRFRREARSIARLHHPNIVGIYQYGEFDALYYMAMVYIDGRDLGQILKECSARSARLPLEQTLLIMHDIGAALDYAHEGGVIHRDIKPSNIMVMPDGHAVLTDFGLALSVPEGSLGNTFGSAHYIAPEQAVSSAQAVPQSDLYSLAVVLYQMLTGKVPFDDPSAMSVALKHISDPPPPLRKFAPDLPLAAEQVVLKALEKDPNRRYPKGETLFRALDAALMPTIIPGWVPPGSSPSRPRSFDSSSQGSRPSALRSFVNDFDNVEMPTLSLSNPSQASRATWSEKVADLPRRARRRERARRLLPFLAASLGIIALIAAVALLVTVNNGSNGGDAIQTAVSLAGVSSSPAAALTDEPPTDAPTTTDAPTLTLERATETIAASVDAAITTMSISPQIAATETPPTTRTNTRLPTVTPTDKGAVVISPEPASLTPAPDTIFPVVLRYDALTLVLHNQSDRVVDLRGLRFVRLNQLGREIAFESEIWGGESSFVGRLPPGGCYQVWLISMNTQPVPSYCDSRFGWQAVGSIRQFWLSSEPDMTFEIRRGSRVFATCPTNEGVCGFDLSATNEPDD